MSQQKLLSLYLDVSGLDHGGQKGIVISNSHLHGQVNEHLTEYFEEGWKVEQVTTAAGGPTGAWVVVVLTKPKVGDSLKRQSPKVSVRE